MIRVLGKVHRKRKDHVAKWFHGRPHKWKSPKKSHPFRFIHPHRMCLCLILALIWRGWFDWTNLSIAKKTKGSYCNTVSDILIYYIDFCFHDTWILTFVVHCANCICEAEIMQHAGIPGLNHSNPNYIYTGNLRSAKATDQYICNGNEAEDESFEWYPRLTYHGFRFVQINTSLAENVKLDLTSVHLLHFHSAVVQRTNASFPQSPTLNTIQTMALGGTCCGFKWVFCCVCASLTCFLLFFSQRNVQISWLFLPVSQLLRCFHLSGIKAYLICFLSFSLFSCFVSCIWKIVIKETKDWGGWAMQIWAVIPWRWISMCFLF